MLNGLMLILNGKESRKGEVADEFGVGEAVALNQMGAGEWWNGHGCLPDTANTNAQRRRGLAFSWWTKEMHLPECSRGCERVGVSGVCVSVE